MLQFMGFQRVRHNLATEQQHMCVCVCVCVCVFCCRVVSLKKLSM